MVKGEGAKEVEREVRIRILLDALTQSCRVLVSLVVGQPTRFTPFSFAASVGLRWQRAPTRAKRTQTCGNSPAACFQAVLRSPGFATAQPLASPGIPSPRAPKRFVSGLEEVPEEGSVKAEEHYTQFFPAAPGVHAQAAVSTPRNKATSANTLTLRSQRSRLRMMSPQPFEIPASPSSRPDSSDGQGSEGGSAPPTPSRRSKEGSAGKLADFTSKMKIRRKFRSFFTKTPLQPIDPSVYGHLFWNGPLKTETIFHSSNQSRPSNLGKDYCREHKLTKPVRIQYKVYLFERILLCCKEINMNKPKNKMLGNNKTLVDKKGKPRLQLKGRIFMQNVTDVLTVVKSGMFYQRN